MAIFYNITENVTTANNLLEMAVGIDVLSDGWLSLGIMLSFFFIMLMGLQNMRGVKFIDSLLASSFVSVLLGIAMLSAGFPVAHTKWVFGMFIIVMIAGAWIWRAHKA